MITNDHDHIQCDHEGCDATVKNHRWGKTKAEGWFFTRDNAEAWCPNHLPDWVVEWRARRAGSST